MTHNKVVHNCKWQWDKGKVTSVRSIDHCLFITLYRLGITNVALMVPRYLGSKDFLVLLMFMIMPFSCWLKPWNPIVCFHTAYTQGKYYNAYECQELGITGTYLVITIVIIILLSHTKAHYFYMTFINLVFSLLTQILMCFDLFGLTKRQTECHIRFLRVKFIRKDIFKVRSGKIWFFHFCPSDFFILFSIFYSTL